MGIGRGLSPPSDLLARSSLHSRRQASTITRAGPSLVNQCSFKHSWRNMIRCRRSGGTCPVRSGAVARLRACAQLSIARPQSSLPLSVLIALGSPRVPAKFSKIRTSWLPLNARSGTIATDSCVASSTTVRLEMLRPLAVQSNTKSMDHAWLAAVGRSDGWRLASGTFLHLRFFTCRPT